VGMKDATPIDETILAKPGIPRRLDLRQGLSIARIGPEAVLDKRPLPDDEGCGKGCRPNQGE
jgi:hypothetical protein